MEVSDASGVGKRPDIATSQRVAPTGAFVVWRVTSHMHPKVQGGPPMFESLSDRLSGVFDKLTKQGALSDADVATALREVRVALLEADVSLPVARDFVKAVQQKATGQAVTKSVTPGQQVVTDLETA